MEELRRTISTVDVHNFHPAERAAFRAIGNEFYRADEKFHELRTALIDEGIRKTLVEAYDQLNKTMTEISMGIRSAGPGKWRD
jgi:hypothetical protein